MTDVLVCVKRVPDVSGEVLLTDDKQSVDARFVGFTTSDHEQCAVEIAVQVSRRHRRHRDRRLGRGARVGGADPLPRSASGARRRCSSRPTR